MEIMAEHEMIFSNEILLTNLMAEHGTELKRIAYLYVKDYSLAEDIIQEVFISCYHHLNTFRQESSYKTWLIRITVNKSKDTLRKWSFRNLIPKNDIEPTLLEIDTPETNAVSVAEKKELIRTVMKLPIKLREVIILFYYKELSVQEMCEVLQLSESTIKTRLFRARGKLKASLERSGFHG
ncbi:sigma-70 family RNA polymerase sigma factor [Sutcliffiella horikoshii]|uniref:sigma-70 family RNA polymerase sigma factor n=1 Tax=Sutcliffiella horikoshii TaxID=79883 RepID=UPI003CED3BA3